jgi:sec-independent protein translocase protein TatC
LHELRRRLFYVAVSVGIWSAAAYGIEHQLINWLLRPAKGQDFIYTSPLGGVDFLFRLSLYVGIIISIPVIVYQLLRYVEPLINKNAARFIAWGSAISGVLALAGVTFGYFIGLPAAMNFLLHQFVSIQIKPMLTIQSYMSFVMVYMLGSAMLFQLPLILIFINRIKPLKPSKLFHYERWVILLAFVISGLMNPTPNLLAQLIVAGPIIVMYQVGIGIIAYMNRKKRPAKVEKLLARDRAIQAERLERLKDMQTVWREASAMANHASAISLPKQMPSLRASYRPASAKAVLKMAPATTPSPTATPDFTTPPVYRTPSSARPQKYLNGFVDLHRTSF